jgi:uncharacterized protein YndB with AHSA1/START domain
MSRRIQPVQVSVSSVLDAAVDDVWRYVRGFDGLPDWNPQVTASRIEDGLAEDAVGCVRNFQLRDGSTVRERLLSLSDPERSFAYSMLDSELGLLDYVAELRLLPITDGDRTYVVWSADFRTEPGREREKAAMVEGIFQGGFAVLKSKLDRKMTNR